MKRSTYVISTCMWFASACAVGDEPDKAGFASPGPATQQSPDVATSESSGDVDPSSGYPGETTGPGDSGSSESTGPSASTGESDPTAVCGDGVLDDGEACDDGPANGDYAKCNESCTGPGPRCGDGTVSGPEACDDGNLDESDDCTDQCVAATCGDGVVQPVAEACDDGQNGDPDDGCTDACALPSCGDGLVQSSLAEACDDGNQIAGDGCETDCSPTTKTVFVTSQKLQGDFGGLLTADQFCQSAAVFAGLPGTYMAWLSDGNLRPATRFVASVYPYVLRDGSVVADDFTDLLDGVLDHAINMDELGLLAPEKTYVWSGVKADGYTAYSGCNKWTQTKDPNDDDWPYNLYGFVGQAWQTTDDWALSTQQPCYLKYSLYCFEQ